MNRLQRRLHWIAAPLLAAVFFTSCGTPSPSSAHRARFNEVAAADVVIRYYRWEQINLTKPSYREGGYLVQLSRDTLGSTFDRLHVNRDLAVVVLGWSYSDPDLEKLVVEWKNVLHGLGFKHIVSVRATGRGDDVQGAQIIDDTRRSAVTSKPAAAS